MNDFCKQLEWDSRFFSRRIARIESDQLNPLSLEQALQWCEEEGIECLYFLCSPDDDQSVALAENAGFHLVDVRIELNWKAHKIGDLAPNSIREYREEDLSKLQQIASRVYTNTRFSFDKHFSADRTAELYKEWVTASCEDKGHKVFVALSDTGIAGFIICQFDAAETGRIGLLGVSHDAQGKGYGQKLVQAAQDFCFSSGVTEVRVVTQGRNIAAQRLYQSCGFRSYKAGLWYHKWF